MKCGGEQEIVKEILAGRCDLRNRRIERSRAEREGRDRFCGEKVPLLGDRGWRERRGWAGILSP